MAVSIAFLKSSGNAFSTAACASTQRFVRQSSATILLTARWGKQMSEARGRTYYISLLRNDIRNGKFLETVLPVEAGAQTACGIVVELNSSEHCAKMSEDRTRQTLSRDTVLFLRLQLFSSDALEHVQLLGRELMEQCWCTRFFGGDVHKLLALLSVFLAGVTVGIGGRIQALAQIRPQVAHEQA